MRVALAVPAAAWARDLFSQPPPAWRAVAEPAALPGALADPRQGIHLFDGALHQRWNGAHFRAAAQGSLQAAQHLPARLLAFLTVVASLAVGGSTSPIRAKFQSRAQQMNVRMYLEEDEATTRDTLLQIRLWENRRKLLEADEANAEYELELLSEKLSLEQERLSRLDDQIADVRGREGASGATCDGEAYAKSLPGVLPLLGYWDPLGLSSMIGTTRDKVKFYREAELKHGRVGMLAAFHFLVSENYHPLGGDRMDGVPAILAFQENSLFLGALSVLTAIAIPDIRAIRRPERMGVVPFEWDPDESKQTTELFGGRIGMIAAISMIAKEMATNTCLVCSI